MRHRAGNEEGGGHTHLTLRNKFIVTPICATQLLFFHLNLNRRLFSSSCSTPKIIYSKYYKHKDYIIRQPQLNADILTKKVHFRAKNDFQHCPYGPICQNPKCTVCIDLSFLKYLGCINLSTPTDSVLTFNAYLCTPSPIGDRLQDLHHRSILN